MTLEQLASLVDALLANLGDRNGFSLDEVEDAVLVDWKRDWVSIIANALLDAGVGVKIPK
jgi:hypothetical protein